ncbi:MAG TPA: NAD(P)H-dependent oxidoreductase [Spirochaetota bacterium]|nr:NAD(P)H-dependent oxidoreductase [Spirochaetota bacterium]HOS32826.1 NAD(P)H-dependent oxidoreductase [Spirochaetota bacterium]HOS56361.1 NAD(P)H-dependent oxidoreductase [Spirochaetota bacterium]HQF77547.1 NAD(P)H-dependent oxidoreductase [Spirochaetota bacterium]HQH29753.1 NAD(P)H-dependent oxidoreductase [Spirochaetota bacterium]
MKCVVINGTEIKGCTYNLKEFFLDELKPDQLTEFYFPKDAPAYCTGCKTCFMKSETLCPHYLKVNPIWQAMLDADLIVFAYPVYVLRAPGQIKAFLDHLGVHWFAHRPEPRMFNKTGAIITQSIGAPNKDAQKDAATSLNWLGISRIKKIGFGMMEGVIWNEISEKRRAGFEQKIRAFARQFCNLKPAKKSLKTKFIFQMCKMLQTSLSKNTPEGQELSVDLQHWVDNGWVARK